MNGDNLEMPRHRIMRGIRKDINETKSHFINTLIITAKKKRLIRYRTHRERN